MNCCHGGLLPNIESLTEGDGQINIGHLWPVGCMAVAVARGVRGDVMYHGEIENTPAQV